MRSSDETIRRMEMDNDLSILIQSALQVGLYHYDQDKDTVGEAQLKYYDNLVSQKGDVKLRRIKSIADSAVGIEKLKEKEDMPRNIMYGVYIDDKDNIVINKKILLYLQPSSFFCRNKKDIDKMMSYYEDNDKTYVNIPISALESMKKFFSDESKSLHRSV